MEAGNGMEKFGMGFDFGRLRPEKWCCVWGVPTECGILMGKASELQIAERLRLQGM